MLRIKTFISLQTRLAICAGYIGVALSCVAQGTTFTYQGRLNTNAVPANGFYDFQFSLSNAPSGGNQIGSTVTQTAIGVTNGLFTTTLNFGAVFAGNATWLAISVRSNGVGNYTAMTPLQELNPTPYAIFANTASNVSGPVSAAQLSGDVPNASLGGTYGGAVTLNNVSNNFSGNGANLTNVNAQSLDGLNASNFWQLTGNSGTTPGVNFVGTSDNQPVELHVNGGRALRLEVGGASQLVGDNTPTGAPNVIGGSQLNYVTAGVVGCVIAGGGATNWDGSKFTNSIGAYSDFSVIGGGLLNFIQTSSVGSVISGGQVNIIETNAGGSVIGGGGVNTIQSGSQQSTVSGGEFNDIQTNSPFSTISGGESNVIQFSNYDSVIGGGEGNVIQSSSYGSVIGGGEYNYLDGSSQNSIIAGGYNSEIEPNSIGSVIGGGYYNDAYGFFATVGGGGYNGVSQIGGTVAGGYQNSAVNGYDTVGGGINNTASGGYSTVPGGAYNTASGLYSFAAGQSASALHQCAFVWSDDSTFASFSSTSSNQFLIRAAGGVGIGTNSPSAGLHVSTGGNALDPQLRVGQRTSGDYARLRMVNEGGSGASWDVAVGGSPNTMNFFASPSAGGTGTNILVLQPNGNASLWGTLAQGSDRAHKENIKAIDPQNVLAKVAAIPISEWNYTTEPGVPHLGPMAQDFYAAFNLGQDNKHITTIDEGGVALAAIQGLDQKLNEKDTEIQTLKTQNDSLTQRLSELESAVKALAEKK